jgi:hypothetical protein
MPSSHIRKSLLPESHSAAEARDPDVLDNAEAVHEALLQVAVFVSIARELDRDERWAGRITVLLSSAIGPLEVALKHIDKTIEAIFERRKRELARKATQ